MDKIYLYRKSDGLYVGNRRGLAPGEKLLPYLETTPIRPNLTRLRASNERVFFRNGKWEFEPKPKVEPNQEIG